MKKLAFAFITLAAAASSQAVDLKSVFEQALSNDPQLAGNFAYDHSYGRKECN